VKRWLAALLIALLAAPTSAQIVCVGGGCGGGGTPGTSTVTGCTNAVLYGDANAVLNCESALSYNATTNAFGVGGLFTVTGTNGGAALGSELTTNGTFTGNANNWTLGGGGGAPDWAYNSNNVTHGNSGGTTALQPSPALTIAAAGVYKVSFVLSAVTTGSVTVSLGGTNAPAASSKNGSFAYTITATNTNNLLFTPTTTFVGTLDTVTVQQLTANTASMTITDTGTPNSIFVGPASQRNFCLGSSTSCQYMTTGSSNNLIIGANTSGALITSGNINTFYGHATGTACTNCTNNVLIGGAAGQNIATGDSNTCVGVSACANVANTDADSNTCVGKASCNVTTGDFNAMLGATTGGSGTASFCLALGAGADCTASNQAVIGGDDSSLYGITSFIIGNGVVNATPATNVTITSTGGSGTDKTATNVIVAPGISTGTGTNTVSLSRNLKLATGSTAQTQVPGVTICPRKILSNTSATAQTIAIIDLASNSAGGATANITVTCSDGTNFDSETVPSLSSATSASFCVDRRRGSPAPS